MNNRNGIRRRRAAIAAFAAQHSRLTTPDQPFFANVFWPVILCAARIIAAGIYPLWQTAPAATPAEPKASA